MTAEEGGRSARPRLRVFVIGLLVLGLATAAMLPFATRLDKAHVALLLLLVPLGGSAAGGRMVGLSLAAASFLVFNWFFLPPYHTLVVAEPLDWLVLLAFLVTSTVAAQLLYIAQEEARVARLRTAEVNRLRVVGAEALNAGRAEDALNTVAEVIREAAHAEACELIATHDGEPPHVVAAAVQAPHRAVAADVRDDVDLPLSVRGRAVGTLRLRGARGMERDAERVRFVEALSYYAALGIERVRLIAAVERAEALREANELKDALLASVSHDLRTPLTTIKARAQQMRVHGDEQAEVIEQEADRLNRIVVDLLDLSRLKAGALPTNLELNAVDELLELVVQRVEGVLGKRRLVVQLSADGELLFGRFDLAHSVRIVVNLVENAHKYAPPDTPIELGARRVGDLIEVAVSDRGPGLAASEHDRAFEPFNRAPGHPPDVGGAGLGLAIARRLAEAQCASLRYESRDGGGSVFTYAFPAVEFTPEGC